MVEGYHVTLVSYGRSGPWQFSPYQIRVTEYGYGGIVPASARSHVALSIPHGYMRHVSLYGLTLQ